MIDYANTVVIDKEVQSAIDRADLMSSHIDPITEEYVHVGKPLEVALVVTIPMLFYIMRNFGVEINDHRHLDFTKDTLEIFLTGYRVYVIKSELYNSEPHCIPVYVYDAGALCDNLQYGDTLIYDSSLYTVHSNGVIADTEIKLFDSVEVRRLLRQSEPSTPSAARSGEWQIPYSNRSDYVKALRKPREKDELQPSQELDDYISQFKIIKE